MDLISVSLCALSGEKKLTTEITEQHRKKKSLLYLSITY